MQKERSFELRSEPFEVVELDDIALLGVDQSTNSCCPINTDCTCLINALLGCGGCGEGGS
jgi:hypothetical protein